MRLKKISSALMMLLVSVMFSVPVMAQNTGDTIDSIIEVDKGDSSGEKVLFAEESENLGSITVRLENTIKNSPKNGVKLAVSKVADVVKGEFILSDRYSATGVDLNNVINANELENAAKKLEKSATPDTSIVTDMEGVAKASDLSVGVYLIYALDINGYDNITPFLVSIPTFNNDTGEMMYDIEILPKHTPIPEVPVHNNFKTGVEDKSLEYATISALLLALAGGVFLVSSKMKKVSKNR